MAADAHASGVQTMLKLWQQQQDVKAFFATSNSCVHYFKNNNTHTHIHAIVRGGREIIGGGIANAQQHRCYSARPLLHVEPNVPLPVAHPQQPSSLVKDRIDY